MGANAYSAGLHLDGDDRSTIAGPALRAEHGVDAEREPIVITGIGLIASVGNDRESVWQAVQRGQSGMRYFTGLEGIPDGTLIGAPVDIEPEIPGQLKVLTLCQTAASEALRDARIRWPRINRDRFACAISGHMGDSRWLAKRLGFGHTYLPGTVPWWTQWMPNTACVQVANRFRLEGPRLTHSTACASGLVEVLSAMRCVEDGQCDIALAGSAEAVHPLFAAGFLAMRVLARHEDPRQACRPFDRARSGFVMGEGAAMFVIERLSHAISRGARIYAELCGGKMLSQAHHLTGLDADSAALEYLIQRTLQDSALEPDEIDYVNAHGTGTQQNDPMEIKGIRRGLGSAADHIWVSSTKSMLGHLVNAAGSVELAITALALRDGFVPPTVNLTDPDPECNLDCIPLVGRPKQIQTALKLSVAFGGHLAAVAMRRWSDAETGFGYPVRRVA